MKRRLWAIVVILTPVLFVVGFMSGFVPPHQADAYFLGGALTTASVLAIALYLKNKKPKEG